MSNEYLIQHEDIELQNRPERGSIKPEWTEDQAKEYTGMKKQFSRALSRDELSELTLEEMMEALKEANLAKKDAKKMLHSNENKVKKKLMRDVDKGEYDETALEKKMKKEILGKIKDDDLPYCFPSNRQKQPA